MKISVPREIADNERRVALVPETVASLVKEGLSVTVQSGAGERAFFPDRQYEESGAQVVSDAAAVLREADVVAKVQRPMRNDALGQDETDLLTEGSVLISFLHPLTQLELVKKLAERKITAFSMDAVPRIARAQKLDALSSQSNIAGYMAVLLAAESLPKFFPMLITAAGTVRPAKVLVLGAGVAGLQAIATAKRLGAVVEAFDIRPVVKDQVQSLGATFIERPAVKEETEDAGGYAKQISKEEQRRDRELIGKHVQKSDVVITTAAVPGRKAPILVTADMARAMAPGSVIIDLAAETGGNCELTRPGENVLEDGVLVRGPLEVPSLMPLHASWLYSRNLSGLLREFVREGELQLDFEDEVVRGSCITHEGRVVHEATKALLEQG